MVQHYRLLNDGHSEILLANQPGNSSRSKRKLSVRETVGLLRGSFWALKPLTVRGNHPLTHPLPNGETFVCFACGTTFDSPVDTFCGLGEIPDNMRVELFTVLTGKGFSPAFSRQGFLMLCDMQPDEPAPHFDVSSFNRVSGLVAERLHNMWRESRKQSGGRYTPDWEDDGEGGQVDIANLEYCDLPAKWQTENAAAARDAVQAVLKHGGNMERAAKDIHDGWLERNSGDAEPHQKVAYEDLSEEEKEKDRMVARVAWLTVCSASSSRTPPSRP